MVSAKEFRKIAQKSSVYAVLWNKQGEYVTSDPIRKMTSNGHGLRVEWPFKDYITTSFPFTHASILDEDGNTLAVFNVSEFDGDVLEVTFE